MNLNEYRKCFDLTMDQFISHNNISQKHVSENVRYENISYATCVEFAKNQFFYFNDGKLKMIYLSDEGLAKKVWSEFKSIAYLETPERTVRSRAGKTSNQLIFSAHGISASINKDIVDFIEIYPPCSLQEYLKKIYQEPMKFIR